MNLEAHELPLGWVHSKLYDICTKPQYGWTTKAKKGGHGIKLLRTTDISPGKINWETVPLCSKLPDNVEKYLLEKGDIVVSRAGSVGVSIEIEDCPKAIFGSYLIRFRTLDPVQSRYVSLFLKSSMYWSQIADNTSGITIPNVNATKLQQISLPLAPLNEQRRIVAKVETLFTESKTVREALDKVPVLLRRFRQSVLVKAFRGELTERDPNDEPAEKLLERIRQERRRKWEEDLRAQGKNPKKYRYEEPEPLDAEHLPKLPEQWEWATLDLISEYVIDCLHSTPKFQETGKYCIDTTCIDEGKIHFDKARKVSENTFLQRIRRLKPRQGDILFAREGTIGNAVLVPENVELCLGQRIMLFRPWPELVPLYFMWGLNSPIVRSQIEPLIVGTTAPHINVADVKKLILPIAPFEEQHRITLKIKTLFSLADSIEVATKRANERANMIDLAILAKAFRGELVPQDPNDEPASFLLQRIKATKQHPKTKTIQQKLL